MSIAREIVANLSTWVELLDELTKRDDVTINQNWDDEQTTIAFLDDSAITFDNYTYWLS